MHGSIMLGLQNEQNFEQRKYNANTTVSFHFEQRKIQQYPFISSQNEAPSLLIDKWEISFEGTSWNTHAMR